MWSASGIHLRTFTLFRFIQKFELFYSMLQTLICNVKSRSDCHDSQTTARLRFCSHRYEETLRFIRLNWQFYTVKTVYGLVGFEFRFMLEKHHVWFRAPGSVAGNVLKSHQNDAVLNMAGEVQNMWFCCHKHGWKQHGAAQWLCCSTGGGQDSHISFALR